MVDESCRQRRNFIHYSGLTGAALFLSSQRLAATVFAAVDDKALSKNGVLNFKAITASSIDAIRVPEGYRVDILVSWGDPLFPNSPDFDSKHVSDASIQLQQFGDNNDGMSWFSLTQDRAILAVNHESFNPANVYAHKGKKITKQDVEAGQAAMGMSIIEVIRTSEGWRLDRAGQLNRRITANTLMQMTGPVASHRLIQTHIDPTGAYLLGTINNCANGKTPWGTYLTCEENFNNFFGSTTQEDFDADRERYGISEKDKYYRWSMHDARFDLSQTPLEPNRFGWVVEIDPFDPKSTPKKRSALGRFKHENAAVLINHDGHVVVYMGDDERGEFLYRFISRDKFDASNPKRYPDLLAHGTLYVAKFNHADGHTKGQGLWLEMTHGKGGLTAANGFPDQAHVMVFARRAASYLGATTMDRPEWVAIHPDGFRVYCSLTNNKDRGKKADQLVGGPNPRANNRYGQILRWWPSDKSHTSSSFEWDLLLIAGNPAVHDDAYAGSEQINRDNLFNSPDGLHFDRAGRLWILTDGNTSNKGNYKGMGNNQMLCADPTSGEVRRFMTGPKGCEVTGICFSDDDKTMFVGIQHPGQQGEASHFPGGGDSMPRSSVVMISKIDGGVIGA